LPIHGQPMPLALVAGEASGDNLGAGLIYALTTKELSAPETAVAFAAADAVVRGRRDIRGFYQQGRGDWYPGSFLRCIFVPSWYTNGP